MSKIFRRANSAIVAAVLLLSLAPVANARPCNDAKSAHAASPMVQPGALYATAAPQAVQRKGGIQNPQPGYGRPQQDPQDAWDGYFANPLENPNYHGSNGG
jgi:hypothetical protein